MLPLTICKSSIANNVAANNMPNKVLANNVAANNMPNKVLANNVAAANNVAVANKACPGLAYSTHEQLRKAQDRRVLCEGKPNNMPVQAYDGVLSAQGYGVESPVTGFNEYGHKTINNLCVKN